MESDLDLISKSTDYNCMVKGELFNLLKFQCCFPKNGDTSSLLVMLLMTEITYVKHSDASSAQ